MTRLTLIIPALVALVVVGPVWAKTPEPFQKLMSKPASMFDIGMLKLRRSFFDNWGKTLFPKTLIEAFSGVRLNNQRDEVHFTFHTLQKLDRDECHQKLLKARPLIAGEPKHWMGKEGPTNLRYYFLKEAQITSPFAVFTLPFWRKFDQLFTVKILSPSVSCKGPLASDEIEYF